MQNCSTLEIFQENNDPRELPRPNKYISKNHTSSPSIFTGNSIYINKLYILITHL